MIELIDRFGKFPVEINNLFKLMEIKLLCWENNIELIEFSRKGIVFGFYLNKPPNPEKLMKLGFAKNNQFNIRPDQKIFYDFMGELNDDRFILTKKLISKLK
jgi:transcription-repair coupling factor (superfamily II helicase)